MSAADRLRALLSEDAHRLVRAAPSGVACSCGQYAGPNAGNTASNAWREHLIAAVLPLVESLEVAARTTEAALTPTGDHHTLPDGYCLDCSGGCIVPLARENTEALRRAAYAKPDPFAVKDGAR